MTYTEYHLSKVEPGGHIDGVLATGPYRVFWCTNDNSDAGVPNDYAEANWFFPTIEKAWAFIRGSGNEAPITNSWYGFYGQPVRVYVEGMLLPFEGAIICSNQNPCPKKTLSGECDPYYFHPSITPCSYKEEEGGDTK